MVKIALCDDNPQALDYYQSILTETAVSNGIEVKILRFTNGEQMLFHFSDNPNCADIIYVDILMGKMNGLETARKLRAIGCLSLLIYLTSSNEYVFEAFDVEPFYYIVKEEMPVNKFKDVFLRAVDAIKAKEDNYISITYGATTAKILLDRIYYFEIRNRLVTVHSYDNDIDFYSSLEEIEQSLASKGFVRIHRSYLVNCHHIKKLLRTQLILTDGTELPVGAKYSQSVQTNFSKYLLHL